MNAMADAVAKATDDHTIGVMINGNMTIAKLLNPATPFDPLKDLAPISLLGSFDLGLFVPANSRFATLKDLVAHAKAHAGFFDAEVARTQAQDVAAMFFTSGSSSIAPSTLPLQASCSLVQSQRTSAASM